MKSRKIIKTEKEYQKALNRLEEIFDAKSNTKEGEELELLSLLIDDYEKKQIYIDLPDPIEAIIFRMDQMNLSTNDLGNIL